MYEIEMMGDIVNEGYYDSDVSPKRIKDELAKADGEEIYVPMNSGGGSTIAGSAVINMMRAYKGTITVHNIGISASMASVILAEADVAQMSDNALLMIHNPWSMAVGDADDMKNQAEILDKIKASLLQAYVRKTGLPEEEISDMMDKETWLTAQEAYNLGFIDEITTAQEVAAHSSLDFFGGNKLPEQARAYFKQKQTETNMSEEKQEKGLIPQKVKELYALVTGGKVEPVQKEVVAEASVDFEAKFNELDVEMRAQIEDHKAEIEKLKDLHIKALAQAEESHKAELEEVVAKVEVIAKAFEDGKLSVHEAKEELKSEAKSDEVEAKLDEAEDKFSADVEKESIEANASEYDMWMSIEDTEERQKYYREHSEKIDAQYELSK
jgi:ATP-dependent Clp protease protease subunit